MDVILRAAGAALCVGLLLFETACTPGPRPLPASQRAELGSIGLVCAVYPPEIGALTPASGRLAAAGRKSAHWAMSATEGIFSGGSGGGSGNGYVLVAYLLLATAFVTVAAVGGLAAGAIQGGVKGPLAEQERDVRTTLQQAEPQRLLGTEVARLGVQAGLPVRLLEIPGPADPEERPTYQELAGSGIDSVIEIAVERLLLQGEYDIDPPLIFRMTARVRVVRVLDGRTLYDQEIPYQGEEHRFAEWAAGQGSRLRREVEAGFAALAQQIGDKLLGVGSPEGQ